MYHSTARRTAFVRMDIIMFGEAAENSTRAACAPLRHHFLASFAHVSLNVAVRFQVCFSGFESESSVK